MSKNKILIILAVLIIVVIIFAMYRNSKNKSSKNTYVVKQVMNSEAIKEELRLALNICEEDYKEGLSVNPYYTRNSFYNDTRLSSIYYDGTIKFVNKSDLYVSKDKEFLDSDGNEVSNNSELVSLIYKGEEVQVSDNYELEVGKYYLVKYQKDNDTYSYCFVGKMGDSGFEDFDLYCVIEEDLYLENEEESLKYQELDSYYEE